MIRNAYTRAQWALPMSGVIYLLYTVLSFGPAWSLDHALARIAPSLRSDMLSSSQGAAIGIEVAIRLYRHIRDSPGAVVLSGAFAALLAPWLCVSWVKALDSRSSLVQPLRAGGTRTVDSMAVTVLHLIGLVVVFSVLAALLWGVHKFLAFPHLVVIHDLALLPIVLAALVTASAWATSHDLARVALIVDHEGPLRAVSSAVRSLRRPRLTFMYLAFFVAGLLCLGAPWFGASHFGKPAYQVAFAVLAQLGVLSRVLLRSLWLGYLVAYLHERS